MVQKKRIVPACENNSEFQKSEHILKWSGCLILYCIPFAVASERFTRFFFKLLLFLLLYGWHFNIVLHSKSKFTVFLIPRCGCLHNHLNSRDNELCSIRLQHVLSTKKVLDLHRDTQKGWSTTGKRASALWPPAFSSSLSIFPSLNDKSALPQNSIHFSKHPLCDLAFPIRNINSRQTGEGKEKGIF